MNYAMEGDLVISSPASERATFIRRTYAHLAGAILAFVAIEFAIFTLVPQQTLQGLVMRMFGGGSMIGMLLLLGAFMGVSMLANYWARSETSQTMQYMGLGLYVLFEAFIFVPLLYVVIFLMGPKGDNLLPTAGILTLCVFGGLSMVCFTTGKDFSFLGPIVSIGFLVAFGVIVCGIIFGFNLGLLFSFAMVALLSGSILYETSQVMYHYRTTQYVSAALALFAAFATLLWYIIRILMQMRSGD